VEKPKGGDKPKRTVPVDNNIISWIFTYSSRVNKKEMSFFRSNLKNRFPIDQSKRLSKTSK
jgi:hypothetical protein